MKLSPDCITAVSPPFSLVGAIVSVVVGVGMLPAVVVDTDGVLGLMLLLLVVVVVVVEAAAVSVAAAGSVAGGSGAGSGDSGAIVIGVGGTVGFSNVLANADMVGDVTVAPLLGIDGVGVRGWVTAMVEGVVTVMVVGVVTAVWPASAGLGLMLGRPSNPLSSKLNSGCLVWRWLISSNLEYR